MKLVVLNFSPEFPIVVTHDVLTHEWEEARNEICKKALYFEKNAGTFETYITDTKFDVSFFITYNT
jgi:hypothetical protein